MICVLIRKESATHSHIYSPTVIFLQHSAQPSTHITKYTGAKSVPVSQREANGHQIRVKMSKGLV